MRHPLSLARRLAVGAVVSGVAAGGCAHAGPGVSPDDVPRLERELAADPGRTDVKVLLGVARYEAGAFAAARDVLDEAVADGTDDGAALLYLGLAHEALDAWPDARDAYDRFLRTDDSGPLADRVRHRLELMARNALRTQARQALEQEAVLSTAAATPRSVAVLPFGFNSNRQDLQPLVWALADMMTTDLAVAGAVTVLERARIQSLLDEMALTEAGYADPAAGARTGRLLRAEHVVQGVITTLGQDRLRLDTEVLDVPADASAGTLDAEDALTNLFDLEKDLVFRTLRDVLGVTLTPAEEQAIRENRVDNVLAFLAYGDGLRARDRGDYGTALARFQEARRLDPGFRAAADATTSTEGLRDAADGGADDLAAAAGSAYGADAGGSLAGALRNASEGVNPTPTAGALGLDGGAGSPASGPRDPVQEALGREGVVDGGVGRIRIVIRRPPGGP